MVKQWSIGSNEQNFCTAIFKIFASIRPPYMSKVVIASTKGGEMVVVVEETKNASIFFEILKKMVKHDQNIFFYV